MKKIVILWMMIGLFATAEAQNDFSFGPKMGLNLTNISNSDGNNKASIHLGAFANARLTDLLGMQVELMYSRQGVADKFHMNGEKVKVKARVNYLNIPVLAQLHVYKGLYAEVGPQFGFALNARQKIKSGSTVVKEKIDDLNVFDLSWALGVSYELDMGFVVSARYNLGITNVFDKDVVGVNNKNRVFQLSVGYKLNF